MPAINTDMTQSNQEKDSLLDEVQFKANYKQWKKKKMATVRMRKTLPASDPYAVCIRFEENDISHDELKAKIERETNQKVAGLQFDPVSVHSIDPEATSRWIVRFPESTICDELSQNGLKINGVKLRVRKFDDVMREEHEAYKLYKLVKDFTDKKSQKTTVRKDVKMPKVLKTMHTQTKQA
jgi:hypothetical protein